MKRITKASGQLFCQAILFLIGGIAYGLIEIICRGYTHISMVITGGICFLILNQISKKNWSRLLQIISAGAIITIIEFLAGCYLNIYLGLGVWDYSREPLNLMGQICPLYSFFWCILSAGVIPLCRFLRQYRKTIIQYRKNNMPNPALSGSHNNQLLQ